MAVASYKGAIALQRDKCFSEFLTPSGQPADLLAKAQRNLGITPGLPTGPVVKLAGGAVPLRRDKCFAEFRTPSGLPTDRLIRAQQNLGITGGLPTGPVVKAYKRAAIRLQRDKCFSEFRTPSGLPTDLLIKAQTNLGITGAVLDDFNRANGALGANWTALPDGGLVISSNQVVGAFAAAVSGSYRSAETFNADQYSEIAIPATPASGVWIGPAVRCKASGDHYVVIYLNAGPPVFRLYKRISGTYTMLIEYPSGTVPIGTKLRLTILGQGLVVLQDGVSKIQFYDPDITTGNPGIVAFGTTVADNWQGSNATFAAYYISTDGNGVETWSYVSRNNGETVHSMRVLRPTSPTGGRAHHFLYAMPVSPQGDFTYGDSINYMRLQGIHNTYNVTIVEPNFNIDPWYGDHATIEGRHLETFICSEFRPWLQTSSLATSGSEQHWLLGFSKSGFGFIDIFLKHPTLFDRGAFWDFPAQGFTVYDQFGGAGGSSSLNYGTDANFQANYRQTDAFIDARKAPFQNRNKLWISGYSLYATDVSGLDSKFTSMGILHSYPTPVNRSHAWDSGWVPAAVDALYQGSIS